MSISSSDRLLRSVCKIIGRCICDSRELPVNRRRSGSRKRTSSYNMISKALIPLRSSGPAEKSDAALAQRPTNSSPPALALVPVTQTGVGYVPANGHPAQAVAAGCSGKLLFWTAVLVAVLLAADSWANCHRANDRTLHATEVSMLSRARAVVLGFWHQVLLDVINLLKSRPLSEVVPDRPQAGGPEKVFLDVFDASDLRQAMKNLEQQISYLDTTLDISKLCQVVASLEQWISQLDTTADVIKLRQVVASLEERISQLGTTADISKLRQVVNTSKEANEMHLQVKSLERLVSNMAKLVEQMPPHQQLDEGKLEQKVKSSVEAKLTKWTKDELNAQRSALESQVASLAGKIQCLTGDMKMSTEARSQIQETLKNLEWQMTSLRRTVQQSVVSQVQATLAGSTASTTAADLLPDYALGSGGARVVSTLGSQSFKAAILGFSWWWRRSYWSQTTPDIVLTPSVLPGSCWPFAGFPGRLLVKLSHPIRVSAISIDHLDRRQSYNDSVASAPREFTVYGLTDSCVTREEATKLGSFAYDAESGPPTQTFPIAEFGKLLFPYVELVIHSNHGNPEYTCLYRFRVHGYMT